MSDDWCFQNNAESLETELSFTALSAKYIVTH